MNARSGLAADQEGIEKTAVSTAMVFAAGLGTRMRPITDTLPKPLVAVGGRTMLDHTLDLLVAAGVRRAVVNIHHLGEQVIVALAHRRVPEIVISDERGALLDQGGGIKAALPLLGDKPFLIANTDAVLLEGASASLPRLMAFFDARRMDFCLLLAPATHSFGMDRSLGDFVMHQDGRLEKRQERQVAPFIYSGFGIMHPRVLAREERKIFPLAPFFFAAAQKGRLYGVRLDGQWLHIGTPQALAAAHERIAAWRI